MFSLSILLRAMQNGVLRFLSNYMDSKVCCSSPCIISTTNTAISQSDEPRVLRLVNDSWPGVSITKKPGSSRSNFSRSFILFKNSFRLASGKYVAPICYVIPPASPAWTLVLRSLSRISVFPVSTWPITQMIGHLSFFCFALSRRLRTSSSFLS